MTAEKPEVPGNLYPAVPPPPSYNAAAALVGGNQFPGATFVAGASSPAFVAIPVARYDTMTSYVEDGSGVHTIITTGTVLDRPIMVKCPFCKMTVTTEIKPTTGCLTWMCCLALTVVGCVYGCCLIPFFSNRLRDVEHFCPQCHNTVALYKRI